MSRLIKTPTAHVPAQPAQRLWQELETARVPRPGVVRPAGGGRPGGRADVRPGGRPDGKAGARVVALPAGDGVRAAQRAVAGNAAPASGPGDEGIRMSQAELDRRLAEARRAGFDEGFAEGLAAGRHEALERLEEVAAREAAALRADLEAFLAELRGHRERAERALLGLALAVAERVVRRQLEQDPAAILPLVEEVAGRSDGEKIRARAHPASAEALRAAAGRGGVLAGVEVIADETMAPGDVILETPLGRYDLRPSTLVARIRERLEAEVSGP